RLTLWRGQGNKGSFRITTARDFRVPAFFQSSSLTVGAAVMLPGDAVREVIAVTDRNAATLQDLLALFDGRRVYSYDMTKARPPHDRAKVHNRWDGADLVVAPQPPSQDAVILSFRHELDPAHPEGGALHVMAGSKGDAAIAATGEVRYPGARAVGSDVVSIITDRATGNALDRLASRASSMPYAGLDILLRTGTVYGVDVAHGARPSVSQPKASALVPPAPGDPRSRLLEIRHRTADGVTAASSPDDVTAATIQAYQAFIAAIPQDLLHAPRAWELINQVFLDELAWGAFFKHISFANSVGRLEYIRSELDKHDPTKNIGEEFIFSYADRFLRRNPLTPALLEERVRIAEQYFITKPHNVTFGGTSLSIDPVIADYYQLVGRFIGSDAASAIERWQNDGTEKLSDEQYVTYAKRLAGMSVYLPERTGLSSKIWGYLERGDLRKLWQRGTDTILSQSQRGRELQTATYSVNHARTTAAGQIVFYDVSYSVNGKSHDLGHLALVQPTARLRYGYTVRKGQAGYDIGELSRLFSTKRFYLLTSGSYTEATLRSSGLSAENGVVKNFHVTHKMDGFVAIVHGRIEVFDLEHGLTLPGRTERLRPIQSLHDFHTFLAWLRAEQVSGFQTHLLVQDNAPSIEPEKTSTARRERRFLLYMRDEHNQRVIGILDVPNAEAINFIEATAVIRRLLHDRYKYAVEAAANLDTGSYDVLRVRTESGAAIYATSADIDRATNLVAVFE
ncbi:MAG TPA: hypothetical protein VEZ11_05775, partial [Thermoanaerobaculia bacterium]|nr:hypothetical protein [Thermoanaerobaculia bacterium]